MDLAKKKFRWLKETASIFFKYIMEFVLTRNNVCKGNIEGPDAKEDVDKVCFEVQKTSDRAGGKPTRDFSLQRKKFCSLNYA